VSADPSRTNPTTGIAACCARDVSGQAAEAAIPCKNSRRRIAFAQGWDHARMRLHQGSGISEMGFRDKLHGSNPELLMSALGQKRTSPPVRPMSASPPKADITGDGWMSAKR
jgi:hypothetical protein